MVSTLHFNVVEPVYKFHLEEFEKEMKEHPELYKNMRNRKPVDIGLNLVNC